MSAGSVRETIWLREADAGRIIIDDVLEGDRSEIVCEYLMWRRRSGECPPLRLYVNCLGSDHGCWSIARSIAALSEGNPSEAIIQNAMSGGLIIALAATRRLCCNQHAKFSWHASTSKPGFDESHRSDEQRIDHIVSRTGGSREFWSEKAESGMPFGFDAVTAIHLGIIHEIVPREEWYRCRTISGPG